MTQSTKAKPSRIGLSLAALGLVAFGASEGRADQYHYHNVVIGDRAMGLGGAFGGVADDASGVFYNPAGLAFALSNDISGSANAFYKKTVVYKNTLGDKSFNEYSGGSLAPFFGGLQKLDNISPGLVAAFGVATIDSELKDQDDLIEGTPFKIRSYRNGQFVDDSAYVHRLHRTVTVRSSTQTFGGAVAKRLSAAFAVGLGVNYVSIGELVQEYQDNQIGQQNDANKSQVLQNIRNNLTAAAIEPVLGLQWAIGGRWSVGLTLKYPIILSQNLEDSTEKTTYTYRDACEYVDGSGQATRNTDGKTCEQLAASGTDVGSRARNVQSPATSLSRTVVNSENEEPMKNLPAEARLGMAWFASTRFLLTFDAIHKTAAKSGDAKVTEREAVTNVATGMEYYVTPSVPLRLGLFTNFDSRPEVSDKKANQADHIDYYGGSLFFAWVQPNSQVSLGAILQTGEGKAQKAGGYTTQDVEAMSTTLAFSASHNF